MTNKVPVILFTGDFNVGKTTTFSYVKQELNRLGNTTITGDFSEPIYDALANIHPSFRDNNYLTTSEIKRESYISLPEKDIQIRDMLIALGEGMKDHLNNDQVWVNILFSKFRKYLDKNNVDSSLYFLVNTIRFEEEIKGLLKISLEEDNPFLFIIVHCVPAEKYPTIEEMIPKEIREPIKGLIDLSNVRQMASFTNWINKYLIERDNPVDKILTFYLPICKYVDKKDPNYEKDLNCKNQLVDNLLQFI